MLCFDLKLLGTNHFNLGTNRLDTKHPWVRIVWIPMARSVYLAMERSKIPKNCRSDVWYMTFTMLISTIKKYRMEPRVATGRNSSRARLIFTSVSAATASFSLTSSAVSFVVFSTATRDSSSTSEPCN